MTVMEEKYINLTALLNYLRALRRNRSVNTSPHMDNALLNIQQLLELNTCNTDYITIGGCRTCRFSGKHKKCSCCRRNRYPKDCWEEGASSAL